MFLFIYLTIRAYVCIWFVWKVHKQHQSIWLIWFKLLVISLIGKCLLLLFLEWMHIKPVFSLFYLRIQVLEKTKHGLIVLGTNISYLVQKCNKCSKFTDLPANSRQSLDLLFWNQYHTFSLNFSNLSVNPVTFMNFKGKAWIYSNLASNSSPDLVPIAINTYRTVNSWFFPWNHFLYQFWTKRSVFM